MTAQSVSIGTPPIELEIRYSATARRYGLRISPRDGSTILTIPKTGNLDGGLDFAKSKEAWLRRSLSKIETNRRLDFNARIPVLGRDVGLQPALKNAPGLVGDTLFVKADHASLKPKLKAFYKTLAREVLVPKVDFYAAQLGERFGRITFRDTVSRWGSCTSRRDLMFSFRLVMAPEVICDYVVAHEVCHLREMNHSAQFWALVGDLMPDYPTHRRWLKSNGFRLQQVPI
ncbi:MAG: SprT family zinc-dependent metalloprotease [Pseudomonadota bacterium]